MPGLDHDASSASRIAYQRAVAHGALLVVVLGCAVLLLFPPERASFYPVCPVYRYLHLLCPGCGTTRALAALLRGHLYEALRWNALFVCLLPGAIAYVLNCYLRALSRAAFRWPRVPVYSGYALLAISLLFGLVRNLPL